MHKYTVEHKYTVDFAKYKLAIENKWYNRLHKGLKAMFTLFRDDLRPNNNGVLVLLLTFIISSISSIGALHLGNVDLQALLGLGSALCLGYSGLYLLFEILEGNKLYRSIQHDGDTTN